MTAAKLVDLMLNIINQLPVYKNTCNNKNVANLMLNLIVVYYCLELGTCAIILSI